MATAQRETTLPNQTSTNPRQSTWVCTPLEHPGFIQTNPDSRRALEAPPRSPLAVNLANCQEDIATKGPATQCQLGKTKPIKAQKKGTQPATKTSTEHGNDEETKINIVQDSDGENKKAKEKPQVDRDGFTHLKLHYHVGFQAEDQVKEGALTYKC
ncbi:hypothetical protein Pst134EA_015351 [Puccinia striiformis f. sp. tritici]|uniref:hypothetical protein n=1 Tax=Puccinia striiformis f. sp. tritici TaxID=168172 RepID=UPI002007965F|nr:hypothetical protein Pst134EA_015351 [Puccinia striiformis f. sp. tritici]KAH9463266.1 hypothetical protein Pst134EA_015351 [Puccinia striiformis f. sp. tritici]